MKNNILIRKMNSDEFDEIFEIMKKSFPLDEYRPYLEQKNLLNNSKYDIYVLEDEKNIKAFISVWNFESFGYIEHFAVNENSRNCGLGSIIIKELTELLKIPICLEVELPNTDFSKRRIEFYKRNGFFLNEYTYVQPPISKGKKEIPLKIMTYGKSITEETFSKIKNILYKEVYGV